MKMGGKVESVLHPTEALMEEGINLGLIAAGLLVEGDAKTRCPVISGNLRGSINSQVIEGEAVIGTPVVYAPHVELGINRPKAGAKPYLRPALDQNKTGIERVIGEYVQRALQRVGR